MSRNRVRKRCARRIPIGTLSPGAGFTLFEMLIVLMIMSLSAALVVPQLAGSLSKMNAGTAARKIAASLRYARSRAVTEHTTYLSVFDLRENRFNVRPSDPESKAEKASAASGPRIYRLPDGVRLEPAGNDFRGIEKDSNYIISFFPTGGSSGGEILIRDEAESAFTVRVDFITGSVQITE